MLKLGVALGFLALNLYTYYFLATDAVIPERRSFSDFPAELEHGWSCDQFVQMDDRIRRNLGVTDYLLCDFWNQDGRVANVYVGYHASQVREEGGGSRENSIHPPAHCLPGSGWDIIHNELVPLEEGPHRGTRVRRLLIARGDERQLVYYWYQSRGRVVAEDWKKILYVGFDRATRQRTDGSLVRFSVPVFRGDEESAEATFRSLAPSVLSRLPAYVPE